MSETIGLTVLAENSVQGRDLMAEHGVGTVIAAGIGQRALDLFAQQGIEVCAAQLGATVEELVGCYLAGALAGTPEGCARHSLKQACGNRAPSGQFTINERTIL